MLLQLQAFDTLFFRDARPFSMGEDNWAEGVFPPYPSVLYGALRTAFFATNPHLFSKAGTDVDPTLALRIRGIFLKAGESFYFPLPLDLVKEKDSKEQCVFPLLLQDAPYLSNCPVPKTLAAPSGLIVETVKDGFIEHMTLKEYIWSNTDQFFYAQLKDFITAETKVGITQDRLTRTAEEHKLYRVKMWRLAPQMEKGRELTDVSLVIDYEGIDLPEKGLLKVGGEGKAVFYNHISWPDFPVAYPQVNKPIFKLYLITPAILEKGWLPGWLEQDSLQGNYQGLKLRLVTAALGKYLTISGFDLKNKRPKPMLRAVPAGSVYYFELLDGDPDRIGEVFHYKPLEEGRFSSEGYGIVLAGGLK